MLLSGTRSPHTQMSGGGLAGLQILASCAGSPEKTTGNIDEKSRWERSQQTGLHKPAVTGSA